MAFFKYSTGKIEKILCSCGEDLEPEEPCCGKCGKKVSCEEMEEEEKDCCGSCCKSGCCKSSCCQDSEESEED